MPVREEQTTRAVRRMRRTLDDAGASLARAHVLVLCSGGIDSSVLVALLARLPMGAAPRRIEVLFLDHGVRDEREIVAEREAARAVAAAHGFTFHERTRAAHARSSARGVQADARTWRYLQAASVAREVGCSVVVTGHNADDQLECALLALIGVVPGADAGMPVARALTAATAGQLRLVRPLLGVTRATIDEIADELGIEHAEDPSNADPDAYLRNAVRHRVVPALLDVHPAAGAAVARRIDDARERSDALDALVEHVLADAAPAPVNTLDVRAIAPIAGPARRAVLAAFLRRELQPITPPRTVDARLVRAVDALAVRPGRAACARVDVAGGACVRRTGYDLVIIPPSPSDRS